MKAMIRMYNNKVAIAVGEVSYDNLQSIEMKVMEPNNINVQENAVGQHSEYLVLNFKDGSTTTLKASKNSYIDLFVCMCVDDTQTELNTTNTEQ